MTIHLSARAAELLLHGWKRFGFIPYMKHGYVSRHGVAFCGATMHPKLDGWCRAEDVRALLRGHRWWQNRSPSHWGERHEVTTPSCPLCSVALDQLIPIFHERNHAIPNP